MSLALSLVAAASAGVWVHRPGTGYVQLSYAHQRSSRVFLEDARLVPQQDEALVGHLSPLFDKARYSAHDASVYLELGVVRGIEVVASLPYRSARNRWSWASGTYDDIVHRNHGFTDGALGLRAGGTWRGVALSGRAVGRAPLYDNSPETLNMEVGNANFEDDRLPLGQGTIELDLGGGAGIGSALGWAQLELGLRLRDRRYSSALPLRLQVGSHKLDPLLVWLGADALVSLGDGRASDDFLGPYGKGPLVVDNQSALAAQLGAALEVSGGLGLTLGVSRTLVGARFPQLTTLTMGLYSDFALPWAREGP